MREQEMKWQHEEKCSQVFLNWLTLHRGIGYELKRAVEVFPELKRNWDFVASYMNGDEWVAIELKCLVVSKAMRQFSDWHNLVAQVDKNLSDELAGTFILWDLPRFVFDQRQRQKLTKVIAQAIREVAPKMKEDDQSNLGSKIAALFGEWPQNRTSQPAVENSRLIYPPHNLILRKTLDKGSSIRCMSVAGNWVDPAFKEAITQNLVPSKDKLAKASKQLELGKSMGAEKTILLLHDHIDWEPSTVIEIFRDINALHLSYIDEVFLVSTDVNQVQQVWPLSEEAHSNQTGLVAIE